MSEWISIKDSFPNENELVLIFQTDKGSERSSWRPYVPFALSIFEDSSFNDSHCGDCQQVEHQCVTHWMPLPQPPKE